MALTLGALYNYDAKLVTAFVNGVLMTNFSDGDGISISMNEDQFKLKVGNTGEATRSKTNNLSGRFTFSLMQSSPANDFLTTQMITDLAVPTGTVYPIAVKDNLGTSFFIAPACWLTKWPDHKNAMEAQAKVWVFETGSLSMQFHGGNLPPVIV
jgi:Bacteriophage KPP10, Structural protein ORF10